MTPTATFQSYLDALVGVCLYGPLRVRVADDGDGAMVASPNWARNRQPFAAEIRRRGPVADWPPHVAAACSSLSALIACAWTGRPGCYSGRSTTAVLYGPLADLTRWVGHPTRRTWTCSRPPHPDIWGPVAVALQAGHSWILVDCDDLDGLYDPRTGAACSGVWALAADGSYRDEPGPPDGPAVVRRYSCKALTWEPLTARARRSSEPWRCANLAVWGAHAVGIRCVDQHGRPIVPVEGER